ncbi:MAG TPA: SpoIIE family protein phosphatase [Bryobacteraceae bacterium]|nr:SpoIIE family protein phosphatase [Bryobacteraceae bacterium]
MAKLEHMAGVAPIFRPHELLIHTPDGKTRTLHLDRDRFVVGRSSTSELCYPEDAGLSRQHLALEKSGDQWTVRDLSSKNGTFVNGIRIAEPHILGPDDRVTAGHLTLEFAEKASLPANTVVFVEGASATAPSTTVATSLQGLLNQQKEIEGGAQMRALIRVGRELSGHMPLNDLFTLIMNLSIEAVGAARGVLMTLEGDDLVVRAARGEGFRISSAVRDRVINEKTSLLVRDARLDEAFAGRMSIVQQQIRSMLAAPLQTDDRVIGLIYLDSPHFVHEFTKDDLNLLTVMANVAAIRIEHIRLAEVEQAERMFAKELEQAAEIQRRLLPTTAPSLPGVDLAGYNAPCRTVGGDYYDFLTYADGRVAMLVGDVAGKGMPAALLMSSLQARVQVLFDDPVDLAALVTRLNRIIHSNCPSNRFISFFIGVLDPKSGELAYVNAGHNPPLLARNNGSVEKLDCTGLILGILPAARYEQKTVTLDVGDALVLFSDGVTEASRPDVDEEFGEDRLAETFLKLRNLPAQSIVHAINHHVQEFTAGAPPADDITLLVARRVAG